MALTNAVLMFESKVSPLHRHIYIIEKHAQFIWNARNAT